MNQTSWIAAFLFLGFIVFVTIRGELPQYKDAILGGETTSDAQAAATAATNAASTVGSVLTHLIP